IKTLKAKIKFCRLCGSISADDVCPVCADERRKRDVICVVEEAKDVFFIENTGRFNGLYHVLGGKISPLDGIGPSDLRFSELIERVKDLDIKEVIIATNPDVDGETTASYIGRILGGINDLKITKLASGIPIGSHLEYADEITVLRALENRVDL
ncbi:MAG: recombination mediator RecR, partial [Mucispirillum sp.]|nr:recombination mediator RecR [Mucispirillum sp.]